ncbi:MAG: hypothetical protein EOO85_14660 [Pedobacter sp.]|nr:MAG: hypothetical protein EOO85_14660 [Pedobacter sp.]
MRYSLTILIVVSLANAISSLGQSTAIDKKLAYTIDSLKNVDQSGLTIQNGEQAQEAYKKATKSNFSLVKRIADKYGFPGYDLVGKESSNNYWLLVQHSDFDVPFQKRALELMRLQVEKKNASGQNYAYLIDRINLNEGKEQIYGTQVNMGERGTTLKPCMDTLNLDKRRLAVGLTPIKDYLKKCDEYFQEMNKERLNKAKND